MPTKEETKAYNAAYYAKNKAAMLEKFREWKSANRETHRASSAKWQLENKKRSNAIKAAYKKRNPETTKACNKRVTPDQKAAHAARQSVRNRLGANPNKEVMQFYAIVASQEVLACHWCGLDTTRQSREVDHVMPISKGGAHCVENLVISCTPCNRSKGSLLPDEFRARRIS